MKKTRNIFLLSILVLLIFMQCRKDEKEFIPFCEEFPEQCVDMEKIKDHYYFKTGSWWVYQEVNSLQLDSQWVSQDWESDCKFRLTIKSSLDDYDRERWTHLLTSAKNCGLDKKRFNSSIRRSKSKPGNFIATSEIAFFYPIIGDSVYNFGGGAYPNPTANSILRIKTIHLSYNLLNKEYNNVIVINDKYNAVEHSQPTTHYYAQGVGLIKKELIDSNQVWLLIDYNVEQ